MALNRDRQVMTQATARTVIHGGGAGGWSHGGWHPDSTMGMTEGNTDIGGGAHRATEEPM